ncbi:MAG: ABC transporter permease [Bryobacterales bacterium]|nr:ABC transporter permease [Bryobacterales bacterium]
MMDSILRDIRMAVRAQMRDRGFTAAVVVTLLVCVAANTLTFAVVNSVLLRPLPVPEAERIVMMSNLYPKAGVAELGESSAPDYLDRRTGIAGWTDVALFRPRSRTLEVNGVAERIEGMVVTPGFFTLVRTPPALGRGFEEADTAAGNDRKVILSDGLWRQLFGGRADAVGQTLRMDGRSYTVSGVMPAGFQFVNPKAQLWMPLALTDSEKREYHSNNYTLAGRLRPGVGLEQVQAQVDAMNRANIERTPHLKELLLTAGFHSKVELLQDRLVKSVKNVLYLLWGAAVLVLFIGALNVANLSMARLAARRKEIATRLALGAGRGQLMWQSVVESVMVTGAGGALGVGAAYLLLPVLATVGIDQLPRAGEVQIDGFVALVSLAMAAAVGVAMGLLPVTNLFPASLSESLREDNRTGTSGRGTKRLRQGLVVAEVGFAFVLLVGAGVFLLSFRNLLAVNPGYAREGVLTASTSAPAARYDDNAKIRALQERLLRSIRELPGVVAAGATTNIPLGGNYSDGVIFAEGYERKPGESVISPRNVRVTPGYFGAMGMGMVRGREFNERDDEKGERTIIVDEQLARRFWGERDPVGQRMYRPNDSSDMLPNAKTEWMRVVGVVRRVQQASLADGAGVGMYYMPMAQRPERFFTLAVRTAPGAGESGRAMRLALRTIDPEMAMFDVRTMEERLDLSLGPQRTSMTLAMAFGAVALFLSATGIYGVLAYLVTQRRREIGIRVALGSSAGKVVELVLREGLGLVAFGLVTGLAGAVAMQRAVASIVFGVQPLEPVILASGMVTLTVVGLAACVLPARRALQVDPVQVLQE